MITQSRRERLIQICRSAIFWMTLVTIIILLIFYWFVSDRTPFGEWLTIWPPFFYVFGLIPLAMISYNRKQWRRSVVLFGAIVFFVIATTETRSLMRWPDSSLMTEFARLHQGKPAPKNPIAIRLVSWNISNGSGGREAILEKLAGFEPDLCFLQETPDGNESFQSADLSGYWSGFTWRDEGDCGLLSRYPLKQIESGRIGPWSKPQLFEVEPTTGTRLLLCNVRMMLPSLSLNPFSADARRSLVSDHAARLAQFRNLSGLIRDSMRNHGIGNVILSGDFNSPATMASLAPLREILIDAWLKAGRGRSATMTNQFPVSRIDQCWATPEMRIADARVVDGAPSDHRILIVDILIP